MCNKTANTQSDAHKFEKKKYISSTWKKIKIGIISELKKHGRPLLRKINK